MLIVLVGGLVSFVNTVEIDRKLRQIVEVEEPLEQAVLEMEINAGETALAVLDYIHNFKPHALDRIKSSKRDFERYAKTFKRLAETEAERKLGRQVAVLYGEFKTLGDEITAMAKRRFHDLGVFQKDVAAIDALINEKLQPAIDHSVPGAMMKIHATFEMEINIFEAFAAIKGYVLRPNPELRRKIADSEADFERFEAQYRATNMTADETQLLDQIAKTFADAVAAGTEIIALTDAMREKLAKFEAALAEMDHILDDQIQPLIHAETIRAAADAKASTDAATLLLFVIGAIALLIASGSAWVLSKGIVRPMRALVRGTEIIGEGNLTHRIGIESTDEFGDLAASFNRMVEKTQLAWQSVEARTAQLKHELAERKQVEKALRKSEERFKDVATVASDWFWKTDKDHRFVYFSDRFFQVMKIAPETIIDNTRRELIQNREFEAHPEKWRRHFEVLEARQSFANLEYEVVGEDENLYYVTASGVPVFDTANRFRGYRGIGTDITTRRRAEVAMIAAKEDAELANRAKSLFLANMSHELRTPLNAIIGFSDMIRRQIFGPVGSPKYIQYVTDINESGIQLLALINDILDLSKIEASREELSEEAIDVFNAAESCLNLMKDRAKMAGVNLKSEIANGLPLLYADERKLRQALLNLLSNAIKFTLAGGKVTMRAWSRPDEGYVFQVSDTGIGIAEEDIVMALAPFQQIDVDLNRNFEGTGLGLPLTKSLVELHGGSLDLQSEVGIGTTVTVCFPAERIVQAAATGT